MQGVFFFNDYSNLLGADLAASGGEGTTDQFNGGAVNATDEHVEPVATSTSVRTP